MRIPLYLTLLALLALSATAETRLLDGVVARVNNRTVTLGEVRAVVHGQVGRLRASFEGEELERQVLDAYRRGLELLVERQLMLSEFERRTAAREIAVPEHVLRDRSDQMMREVLGRDPESMADALASEGMSLEELREPFRDRVIVALLRSMEVDSRVQIPPSDVRKAYQEHAARYASPAALRFSMIVRAATADGPAAATRGVMEAARAEIAASGDFAATARRLSQGPRAAAGGAWGWTEPGDLLTPIAEALAGLATGELSPVLEVEGQFYLLRVDESRVASVRPFEEVQGEIEVELRKKESARIYEEWIERLKSRAFVEFTDVDVLRRDMRLVLGEHP